jgi:C_GCAxxG_C_C family probable redox protein
MVDCRFTTYLAITSSTGGTIVEKQKIEQAKANALARFADTGPDRVNCSQAVLCYALEAMGDDCDLATVAKYFGGGIAGMGEACGAVTGAAMAVGMRDYSAEQKDPDSAAVTKEALQKTMKAFAEKFGSCRCRDLTGYDLSTPEGFTAFKMGEAHDRCPIYVGWVMDEIVPLLEA